MELITLVVAEGARITLEQQLLALLEAMEVAVKAVALLVLL
jgi:hypothetical protein